MEINSIAGHRVSVSEQNPAIQSSEDMIAHLQGRLAAMEASTTWRMGYPLRLFLGRTPGLARILRLFLKGMWWTVTGQFPTRFRLWKQTRAAKNLRLHLSSLPDAVSGTASTSVLQDESRQKQTVNISSLHFPREAWPEISIIVPVYGQIDITLRCLASICAFPPKRPYEVIVAEDASGDPDVEILRRIPGLVLIERTENLGFLRNVNDAAAIASGRWLYLLNNDTEVTSGAIESLVALLESDPTIGLTGSKLIWPDGRLQEAGGIMWNDASGWNFGRGDDPDRALYRWRREVDYISGASIMLERAFFVASGGFDERYAPAYYEDTDLAFRVRASGKRVVLEPASVVVHHEGVSHGTDETQGIKAFQARNRERMLERWSGILHQQHYPSGQHVLRASARGRDRRTILIVDHYIPEPDRDAGSRATLGVLKSLVEAGWLVKFWPENRARTAWTSLLENMGIECLDSSCPQSFPEWLAIHGVDLDHIMIMRPTVAQKIMSSLDMGGGTFLSFYGHDIHHLRMMREAELTGDEDIRTQAIAMQRLETRLWRQFDAVIYLSEEERDYVRQHVSSAPAHAVIPYRFDVPAKERKPTPNRTILFVGGFAHPPNIDAALWLAQIILPLVREKIPDVKLVLAGSNPAPEVRSLVGADVRVTGSIPDEELERLYDHARVAVVPLRFGAGVKGKVIEALYRGVPVVTTAVGGEGIPGIGNVAIIRDTDVEIAEALKNLLLDDALWSRCSSEGQSLVMREYMAERHQASLLKALGEVPA
jgi:GT2 family glycosyltransferase